MQSKGIENHEYSPMPAQYRATLQHLISTHPNFTADQWKNLADLYLSDKDYLSARCCFEQVIKLNPKETYSLHILGWMYEHDAGAIRNLVKAREYYNKAAEKGHYSSKLRLLALDNPTITTADQWCRLGDRYYQGTDGRAVDYFRARCCYNQAIQLNPNHAYTLFNLGWMCEQGEGGDKNLERAKKCYEKAAREGKFGTREQFLAAVKNNDVKRIEEFNYPNTYLGLHIYFGITTNYKDQIDVTPLHIAAINNAIEIMQFFLKAIRNFPQFQNVFVNARDLQKQTPLHFAAREDNLELIKVLVAGGADPNARTRYGKTVLMEGAGHISVIKFLLEKTNANINATDIDGLTILDHACKNNHKKSVEFLLRNKRANPNGSKAILTSTIAGHSDIVKILLEGEVKLSEESRKQALYLAACRSFWDIVKFLLEADTSPNFKGDKGDTALHWAVDDNELEVVESLLKNQADLNADYQLEDLKASCGTPLNMAANKGYLEIIKLLYAANANPNAKAVNGTTPIYWASRNGHLGVVSYLLELKVFLNIPAQDGSTALLCAARKGYYEIVRLLLNAGANPNSQTNEGRTALHLTIASKRPNFGIVNLLLEAGTDPNIADYDGLTPLHLIAMLKDDQNILDLLLRFDASPNTHCKLRELHLNYPDNATPLHLAVYVGNVENIRKLLRANSDPNWRCDLAMLFTSKKNMTALHVAMGCVTLSDKVVSLLLENNADPNLTDDNGETPLQYVEGRQDAQEVLEVYRGYNRPLHP